MFLLFFFLPLASAQLPPESSAIQCPDVVPLKCDTENREIWCPSAPDKDGCMTSGVCEQPSEICDATCDAICDKGEVLIEENDPETGCPMPGYCKSGCLPPPPVECPEGMILEEGEIDPNGCQMPDNCVCPPIDDIGECNEYQIWCNLGQDKNGCWRGGKCSKPNEECEN